MRSHPYEAEKARLLRRAHDDNHGITMTLDDHKRQLEDTEKALEQTTNADRKRHLNNQRRRIQQAIKDFTPQWIPCEDVRRFIKHTDRLIREAGYTHTARQRRPRGGRGCWKPLGD